MEWIVGTVISCLVGVITYFIGLHRGAGMGYDLGRQQGIIDLATELANGMGIPVSAILQEVEENIAYHHQKLEKYKNFKALMTCKDV